jgi:ABC-type xylose transport system substrate-binding protein
MFADARIALSTIENDDSARIAYYDDKLKNEILWNKEITAQLADAIKNRDIRPYLQPIADNNGKIVVPSYLCEPVPVDKDNYKEVIIGGGYYTEEQLAE